MGLDGFFAVMIVVWVFVALLTAIHAAENNKTGLWGVVVLIFGIFGLLGYAISLASD